MKRTLFFIACMLTSITMMAQVYFPTGMKWEEVNVDPSMKLEYENAHIYEIGSDTLVGNVTYKKVLKDNVFSGICVRESGDKVWLLTKEYPTEFLLYNFDWDDNKEIETEYLKNLNMEGNDYALRKETIPMDKCQDVTINGKTYQYYRDSFVRSQIRGIGKVAELNRYPCLLGYREMAVISPGLVYFKVHWIQRNGEEIFRSDDAKEWTSEAPGGNETEINKQFTLETEEGVMLTYTVISESEKTCMVGEEYHWPVPTARSNSVLKVRGSQPSGDIIIPEVANGYNVIRIEAFAFENSAITNVVIPNSVKTIGVAAFSGCVDLKSVTLPNQLSTIEGETFSGCENLSSIDIPESVTSIGDFAFANCKKMKEINIPPSVTHFGEDVFWNTGFTSLPKLPENLTSIPNGMFYQCTQLTSIEIPQNITRIGDTAFGRCPISEIEIPASVTHIGVAAFANCKNLTNIVIPDNVTSISMNGFLGCSGLKTITLSNNLSSLSKGVLSDCTSLESINIPSGVKTIGEMAFMGCSSLNTISIPENVTSIGDYAFSNCTNLKGFNCYAENVPETESGIFYNTNIQDITLHVPAASVSAYQVIEPWKNFKAIVALPAQGDYRPFVEEGKVWKVGDITSGNPVQRVDYYYFDGDTIVDGKTCKQMMRQGYVNPDYAESHNISQDPSLSYVGAWYEEDKKVYFFNAANKQFKLMYDFSINANDTLQIDLFPYVIGPRKTGGIKGFKGVYRDVWECGDEGNTYRCAPWMESVGIVYGPPTLNVFNVELADPLWFLMECYVGDEVIYLNDACEDGATPDDIAGVRKGRFDFTHNKKIKPRTRISSGEEPSLYGEYNDQQLDINLEPLDDTYQVCITDGSGKAVYEKTINAGNIVGLNIDISAYAKGHYTVTVENSQESFTGEFETLTNGIEATRINKEGIRTGIYNLQGQRLNSLQKGLNIVNGQKVYVK